ncbi:unnamed protein product, partial [Oppiella nova]
MCCNSVNTSRETNVCPVNVFALKSSQYIHRWNRSLADGKCWSQDWDLMSGQSGPRRAMKGTTATQRLKQDYMRIIKDPVPYVSAHPLHNNILEWHYVVHGPEGTPYSGGVYHGKLQFPSEFPFKPPAIYMLTPNGRFKCGVRLCL